MRVNISEATYVAHNPRDLDRNIETTLHSITKHFGRSAFNIDWNKGKTEACSMYLGPHASKHYAKGLHEGTLMVKLPTEASADFIVVVRQYKQVGGILTADGNVVPEVNRRTTQAAAALTAITPKILASRAKSNLFFAYGVRCSCEPCAGQLGPLSPKRRVSIPQMSSCCPPHTSLPCSAHSDEGDWGCLRGL